MCGAIDYGNRCVFLRPTVVSDIASPTNRFEAKAVKMANAALLYFERCSVPGSGKAG